MKRLLTAVSLISTIAFTTVANADHVKKAKGIEVHHAWARATTTHAKNGAAYFMLVNNGSSSDRLVSATSPIAKTVQLHTHSMKDGVMSMRRIAGVAVHPGEPTVLRPGGTHVMLMGLVRPLREDEHFPMKLTFANAGTIDVTVVVQGPGSMGPAGHDHNDHGGMHKPTN